MTNLTTAIGSPVISNLLRSCARCGKGFHTLGKEYICSSCRKTRSRIHRHENAQLSFREQQIVALIQQAKANKEIAYELCLTEGTVKEYLYRIFRKLNVTNRTELALRSYLESHRPEPLA